MPAFQPYFLLAALLCIYIYTCRQRELLIPQSTDIVTSIFKIFFLNHRFKCMNIPVYQILSTDVKEISTQYPRILKHRKYIHSIFQKIPISQCTASIYAICTFVGSDCLAFPFLNTSTPPLLSLVIWSPLQMLWWNCQSYYPAHLIALLRDWHKMQFWQIRVVNLATRIIGPEMSTRPQRGWKVPAKDFTCNFQAFLLDMQLWW